MNCNGVARVWEFQHHIAIYVAIACSVHFLYSRDFYFTGAREPPIVGLLLQRKRTKRKEPFS